MRRRLFQPAGGWPGFFTEIVIVILGVLIALGAQQLVDDWQARLDIAAFRKAVDAELAENLLAYQQRVAQSPCISKRLDELEKWQSSWRDGTGPAMTGRIRRPVGMTLRGDVWETGAATIVGKMPFDQRLAYAALYSDLEAYDGLRLREAAAWQALYAFDQAERLSPAEVNALRGLILSARSLDWSISGNWPDLLGEAKKLKIAPAPFEAAPASERLCEPIAFE